MKIRPAVPSDIPALLRFRLDLWPDETDQWHRQDMEEFFDGKGRSTLGAILIAEDADGTPAGFVDLSIRPYAEGCYTGRVAYLEGWYVIPGLRRKGVGAALVAAAEAWGRTQGCTEFGSDALADNTLSEMAHKALGFTEVETIRCFRKDL